MRKAYMKLLLSALLLGAFSQSSNAETAQSTAQAAAPGGMAGAGPQEMLCNHRQEVLAKLGNQYHESTVAMGVASNGGVLEVLSSDKGKTFTVLLTMPNGQSCLVSMGNDWENVKPKAVGPSV